MYLPREILVLPTVYYNKCGIYSIDLRLWVEDTFPGDDPRLTSAIMAASKAHSIVSVGAALVAITAVSMASRITARWLHKTMGVDDG